MSENKYHLLIIDDSQENLTLMKHMVSRAGFLETCFLSPIEALKDLENDPEKYDLVITDLRMRELDGLQVVKKCKEVSEQLPVILVSAESGFDLAGTDFDGLLAKPLKLDRIKSDLLKFIQS